MGKDPQPAQQLPPSCPPARTTRPDPSAVRNPSVGPARSFGSPGRFARCVFPTPGGPRKTTFSLRWSNSSPWSYHGAPKRGGPRTAAGARARAHYPVADLVQEDTTNGHSPKTGRQKEISRDGHHRRLGRSALHGPAHQGAPCVRKTFRHSCRTTSMTSTLSRKSWPGLTNGARRSSPRKRTARR